MQIAITITADEVRGLYKDGLYGVLGKMEVRRASDVEFHDGLWYVFIRNADGTKTRLPEGFEDRADAIAYEVEYLNEKDPREFV